MNQIGEILSQYATKEVLTVIGALVTAWIGWKTAKGTYSMVAGVAKRASFLGLASAVLLAAGLGTTGLGIGELNSRPTTEAEAETIGMSNYDLLRIIKSNKVSPEIVKEVLRYAEIRDVSEKELSKINSDTVFRLEEGKLIPVSLDNSVLPVPYEEITIDPVKESSINAEESIVSIPVAWGMIGLGFASTICGLSVFLTRHNRRNTDDPNHPNFDSQYAKKNGSVT